jgi:hypothetical protein
MCQVAPQHTTTKHTVHQAGSMKAGQEATQDDLPQRHEAIAHSPACIDRAVAKMAACQASGQVLGSTAEPPSTYASTHTFASALAAAS